MKNILLLGILFILTSSSVHSQGDGRTLNTIVKWDVGLIGSWINSEIPLMGQWVLQPEVGINFAFFGGSQNSVNLAFSGRVALGARNYYDRKNRISKNKKTLNNSGNFFQFTLDYQPKGFEWSSDRDRSFLREIRLIPSWGLRRNIGYSNWVLEGRLGVGYARAVEDNGFERRDSLAYDFGLSIGYVFLSH